VQLTNYQSVNIKTQTFTKKFKVVLTETGCDIPKESRGVKPSVYFICLFLNSLHACLHLNKGSCEHI
jgi:hypothetical protein